MIQVDRDYVIRTLADLVRINSINPTITPGGAGEHEIASYAAESMRRCGLAAELHSHAPGRTTVVGTLGGSGGGRSLLLDAHLDTVGVEGMTDPFSAEIRDGRLYGRGAYDMKNGMAAGMAAAKALADAGVTLGGDLLVAGVADEEYASAGTTALVEMHRAGRLRADGAIVTEPTALAVCLAHKGYLWIEVETVGKAAHGSKFELGVDANMRMGRFLARLEGLERDLRARPPHPLLGPPSLHAAMIAGGTGLSTYAASCRLQVERRTVPGETESQATREIQSILDRLAVEDTGFRASARCYFAREPFEVSREAPIVRAVAQAAGEVLGGQPAYIGDTPWMDAALLAAAGIETVVIGAAGAGAHATEEFADIESVVQLARILAESALHYCGRA
jgi:acetylornithine deacetylase